MTLPEFCLSEIMTALLKSLAVTIISPLYVKFYCAARKSFTCENKSWESPLKPAVSIAVNFLLFFLIPFSAGSYLWYISIILLGLVEDIDILIRKIPAELLILELLAAAGLLFLPDNFLSIVTGLGVNCLWFVCRDKMGMGLFDIFLIMILTLYLRAVSHILLYEALILILWGVTGLILQNILRKDPRTRIPLAPVIISAFAVVRLSG